MASTLGSPGASGSPTATPDETTAPSARATVAPAPTPQPSPDEADETDGPADSGIRGQVLAGPTCPVERADEPCPDRPVKDAHVEIKKPGYHGNFTTNGQGRFVAHTPPGTYTITVAADGMMGGCEEETAHVVVHEWENVTVSCDTGIR